MAMIEEYENTGNWLFRKRSYLPLVLYVLTTVVIYFDKTMFYKENEILFSIICLFISLIGMTIRIVAIGYSQKGTSGRNVKGQVADSLNTRGIYSIVRHPLYLGNFFMWIGIVVFAANFWLIVVVALLFWVYYERIMFAEESYLRLKFGEDYVLWSSNTPAFIPAFNKYQKSNTKFDVKDVIKREFYGFTALAVSFAYIDFVKGYLQRSVIGINDFQMYFLLFSLLLFIVLRFLKKKTNLLN